eukprot:jgi/Tetstr1/466211/TSEL_010769.t1
MGAEGPPPAGETGTSSEKPGVGRLARGYVFLTMRAMELMFEQAKVTRYPHIPPWAFDQREYVQYKFQLSVLEEP